MTPNLELLKVTLLNAQTAAQLKALIIHYTHEEILQVYHGLTWDQQIQIQSIWQRELELRLFQ